MNIPGIIISTVLFGLALSGPPKQSCEMPLACRAVAGPKSCVDYMRHGCKVNGYYQVVYSQGTFTVFCDFNSEPGVAWTLVLSWSRAHKDMPQFKSRALAEDAPVNEESPNWRAYRLPLARMQLLRSQATHWRATCSFRSYQVDHTDYIRASFKEIDPLSFLGQKQCKKVEFIDIRGHAAAHITVAFWQVKNRYFIHTDSGYTTAASGCEFSSNPGSVSSEDNFGFYSATNPKFRCTASAVSTTQYWFGTRM